MCGSTDFEDLPPVRAYMTAPHSEDTLRILFINFLDEISTDESFGIRDIQLDFVNMTTPFKSFCGRSNGAPLPDKVCPCSSKKEYMKPPNSGSCFPCHESCATCSEETANDCKSCYPGFYLTTPHIGQCLPCHSSCETCSGGGSNECLTCPSRSYLIGSTCYPTCNYPLYSHTVNEIIYCSTPCPSKFALWDQSCSDECPSPPYTQSVENTFSLCHYPCKVSQYLYWNGSCLDSCPSPLLSNVKKDRKFCNYPCATTEYLYWNGSCSQACISSLSVRIEGTPPRRFCDYPCGTSEFLYWNGSCISTCNIPLVPRAEANRLFCDFPCSPTDSLFWDKDCSSTCEFPFSSISEGSSIVRNFCKYPCQDNEYLYWNGSCSYQCDFPFLTPVFKGKNLCRYPCKTSEYLYWNGSCLNDCTNPFVPRLAFPNNKYCDFPCSSLEFMDWDNLCIKTCDFPLIKIKISEQENYCEFPCQNPNHYLYSNGSCLYECKPPFVIKNVGNSINRLFCDFPCAESEYLNQKGACLERCPLPFKTIIIGNDHFCEQPCHNSSHYYYPEFDLCQEKCKFPFIMSYNESYFQCISINDKHDRSTSSEFYLKESIEQYISTIVTLTKIMQSTRILDIKTPSGFERLGVNGGRNILSFNLGREVFSQLKPNCLKEIPPFVFIRNNLHLSFLTNFWDSFVNMIIGTVLSVIFYLLVSFCRRRNWSLAVKSFSIMGIIAKWYYILMTLAINVDEIILYSYFYMKTLGITFNPPAILVDFIIYSAFISIPIIIIIGAYLLLKSFNRRWDGFNQLYQGFNNNYLPTQIFFSIYIPRIGLPLITLCRNSMLSLSNEIILLINVLMTLVITQRSDKKRINHVRILILDFMALVMNFCIFILVFDINVKFSFMID